jgi:hypothetical protein
MAMFTTPPARKDILELLPELRFQQKTTVRLHPRFTSPAPSASKSGAPIIWPAGRPWPTCPRPLSEHSNFHLYDIDPSKLAPDLAVPLTPLFQFHRDEYPELGWKDEHTLCHIFGCLLDHEDDYRVELYPEVVWHRSSEGFEVYDPTADWMTERCFLRSCSFSPERLIEYPDIWDLNEEQAERIRQWDIPDMIDDVMEDSGTFYEWEVAVCPSTKIGGYVNWIQWVRQRPCDQCGNTMEHWLTLSGWEWDGGTFQRWMPLEDRWRLDFSREVRESAVQAISSDYMDTHVLFICRSCPDWPVQSLFLR